ncbi:MAG: FHA domain-containing protein [Verrucomicrobiales bacterium]|nr:FHA domain-containing protein [Verrucomicrobiales bacterium]
MLKLQLQIGGPGETCDFCLNQPVIRIGRRADNDLRIRLKSISGHHARLECRKNGELFLIDCDSLNGSFLNGEKIEGTVKIAPGDEMTFGDMLCFVDSFQPELLPENSIEKTLRRKLSRTCEGFSFALQQSEKRNTESKRILNIATAELDKVSSELVDVKRQLRSSRLSEKRLAEHHAETGGNNRSVQPSPESIRPNDAHLQVLKDTIEELKEEQVSLINQNHRLKNREELNERDEELTSKLLDRQQGIFSRKSIFHGDEPEADHTPDQDFFRDLIRWLEMFDDLAAYYDRNWLFPKLTSQMKILKDSFVRLLNRNSVEQFEVPAGERLTIESRHKIQLIHVDDLDDVKMKKTARKLGSDPGSKVVKTLRSGYVYRGNGKDVVIRKADVVVA